MSDHTLEDVVLIEALRLLATAPIWLAGFAWLVVAGWWSDREARS